MIRTETCQAWDIRRLKNNYFAQQHLRKHGVDSGYSKVRSSWLSLSRADRKVLQKAPRFLAAERYQQAKETTVQRLTCGFDAK